MENPPDQDQRPAAPAGGGAVAAGTLPGEAAEGAPCDGERSGGVWRDLLRNLWCGVKLSFFLRVEARDLAVGPAAVAMLAACDALTNLVSSLLLAGSAGTVSYLSVPSFLFHLPLMLLCGLVLARVLGQPRLLTGLPVALISLSIPIELYHYLLEGLARLPVLRALEDYLQAPNYYRFFWWWLLCGVVFLLRLSPAPLSRRLASAGIFLVIVALPLWCFPRGDLWAAPGGGESGELHLTEEVLDAQAHLLDRQLAALLPGEKGRANLYFVGFAGDAAQDVFTKEITAAQRLFDSRFGSAGRSVVLANNPRTATTLPFATATNLERALNGVARVMNREEDVLVVFLTSHGSAEHVLTVDNGALELDGLTPETVRRLLKESGVVWKVLVVSACYSGGYVEPLKDDHTLIMTAADEVHESFGCGYGEEFTWFGQALLQEGLRGTYSLTDAFEKARETVQKWEQEQGETPSNPQIFVGKKMEEKVRQLEKELEKGSRPSALTARPAR